MMQERNDDYNRKNERSNVLAAVCVFLICLAVIITATVLKMAVVCKVQAVYPAVTYLCLSGGIACIMGAQLVYMLVSRTEVVARPKQFAAIYTAITLAYIANLYLELISVYIMPICLAAFFIAPLAKRRDAFTGNLFCNILVSFALVSQSALLGKNQFFPILAMLTTGILGGTLTAYWVSNDTRRLHFILKGIVIAVCSFTVLFVVMMVYAHTPVEFVKHAPYMAIGLVGQVVLAVIFQPIFEAVFNLVTNSRLVELTDHNRPLIRRLINEAPGTFNHSLAVANFAEMCAAAIGENPYLARAAAYYHDVGKLVNPQYFKENQAGYNPHDELLPEVSADIIRSHTTEGFRLCEEYRIPHEIAEITVQHHGTLPIYLFYNKAKQLTDGEVDIEEYCYHGNKPVSKVAAIIMLCDTGEAAIRAMDDPDGERVDALLRKLIHDRIEAGQFDDCDISLRDLDRIRQTIINAYGGQFHKRLSYPEGNRR